MKNTFRVIALLFAALLPSFGQVEALQPSQAAQASIGKARPGVETLRVDAPVPVVSLSEFAESVKAEALDEAAVRDRLSLLAEQNPGHNYVSVVARHADGTPFYSTANHNLRPDAGDDWQSELMGKTTAPTVNTQCNYIALTNDAGAPSAADTTLASEIAANGLSRAQGTYAHTAGTSVYTISKTFTASGTQSFQKAGMFTASSGGTMCFETAVTSGTVNNTDTLTFTWTVNF